MGKEKKVNIEQNLTPIPLDSISFINADNLKYLQPIKAYYLNDNGEEYYRYEVNIDCAALVEFIKSELHFKFVKDSSFGSPLIYVYKNGYYQLMNDNEFKGMIMQYIPSMIRRSKDIDEVFKLLLMENKFYIENNDLNVDYNFINFKNGLLNLNTMELGEHTPDKIFTIQIPVDYIPLNDCRYGSVFEKYLNELVDNDKDMRECILESMGLALSNIPGYLTKKCILMIGPKDCGKTQIKKLLTELIGIKYCSSMELAKMNDNKFGTSELYNKRLAGSNDMQYTTVTDMGIFKQLTGGDPVSIEFKNRGAFSYVYNGILWFLANDYPKFSGKKEQAIYQRFLIIPCEHVVEKDKQDPELIKKMLQESEYIVSLCIDSLIKLRNRKYKFVESERMKNGMQDYEMSNNALLQFVSECCEVNAFDILPVKERISLADFRKYYRVWCNYNGFKSNSIKRSDIDEYLLPKYGTNVKKSGVDSLTNIKMKDSFKEDYGVFG